MSEIEITGNSALAKKFCCPNIPHPGKFTFYLDENLQLGIFCAGTRVGGGSIVSSHKRAEVGVQWTADTMECVRGGVAQCYQPALFVLSCHLSYLDKYC